MTTALLVRLATSERRRVSRLRSWYNPCISREEMSIDRSRVYRS